MIEINRPDIDHQFEHKNRHFRVTAINEFNIVGTVADVVSTPTRPDQIVIVSRKDFAALGQGAGGVR